MAFLPFPHVSFTPLQIYLGKVRGPAAWEVLGIQALWVLLLFGSRQAVLENVDSQAFNPRGIICENF